MVTAVEAPGVRYADEIDGVQEVVAPVPLHADQMV
jgi:hypothetical protein